MADWNKSEIPLKRAWYYKVVGRGRDSGERVFCFLLFGWVDGPEMVNRIVGFEAASEAVGVWKP